MHKRSFDPLFKCLSTALIILPLMVLLSRPVVADDHDWVEKRCEEIRSGLETLEKRAPGIRKELAERDRELEWLQSFQKMSERIYLSRHVPLAITAMMGSFPGMTPEFADVLVNRVKDLPSYINQREIRIRVTELPRLRDEQTEVARQLFIQRDESESLKCSDLGYPLQIIVGKWRASETGNVIEIAPGGDGVLREVSGTSTSYGFSSGNTVLSNFRDAENTLEATLTIRALKEDCPTLEPVSVTATIRFEPGNRTFILTAPSYSYCTSLCRWAEGEGETFSRTYSRVD